MMLLSSNRAFKDDAPQAERRLHAHFNATRYTSI